MKKAVSAVGSCMVGVVMLAGCGGSEPPPKTADSTSEAEESRPREELEVKGEVGALNEQQVRRVFDACTASLRDCINAGSQRVEYIGGDIGFSVQVDSSGTATSVVVDQSTLGDRQTEICMRDALKGKKWPKPVGGEKGQAHREVSFDPPKDVRPPVNWSRDDISEALSKLGPKLEECKQGEPGVFNATLYVDTSGKPLAAGVAVPSASADAKGDCIVEVLMGGKFESPGSWAAKVTFPI